MTRRSDIPIPSPNDYASDIDYLNYLVGYEIWVNELEPQDEDVLLTIEEVEEIQKTVSEITLQSKMPVTYDIQKANEGGFIFKLFVAKLDGQADYNKVLFRLNDPTWADTLFRFVAAICYDVETPLSPDAESRPPERGDLALVLPTGQAGYIKKVYPSTGHVLLVCSEDDEVYNVLAGDLKIVLRVQDL